MEAVNLTLAPVELDPANGPGLLRPADDPDGGERRELVELTDREKMLAESGTIALVGEKPKDDYDDMDRDALSAAIDAHDPPLDVARSDGRDDLEPTLDDMRHALRVADANGGDSA